MYPLMCGDARRRTSTSVNARQRALTDVRPLADVRPVPGRRQVYSKWGGQLYAESNAASHVGRDLPFPSRIYGLEKNQIFLFKRCHTDLVNLQRQTLTYFRSLSTATLNRWHIP